MCSNKSYFQKKNPLLLQNKFMKMFCEKIPVTLNKFILDKKNNPCFEKIKYYSDTLYRTFCENRTNCTDRNSLFGIYENLLYTGCP